MLSKGLNGTELPPDIFHQNAQGVIRLWVDIVCSHLQFDSFKRLAINSPPDSIPRFKNKMRNVGISQLLRRTYARYASTYNYDVVNVLKTQGGT